MKSINRDKTFPNKKWLIKQEDITIIKYLCNH